jgi:hypothetical protein
MAALIPLEQKGKPVTIWKAPIFASLGKLARIKIRTDFG